MTLSRPQLLCVVLLLSTIFTVSYFAQTVPLRLQEKACRLQFDEANTKASLALENASGRTLSAQFRLELLDPTNHVRAHTLSNESIKVGRSTLSFALSEAASKAANKDKLWWRLHYVITPQDAGLSPIEGYISASEITPDIFDLQVFASPDARANIAMSKRMILRK